MRQRIDRCVIVVHLVAGISLVCTWNHVRCSEPDAQWLVPVETYIDGLPNVPQEESNPGQMILSADGKWLAAISTALLVYRRQEADGTLKLVAQFGGREIPGLQRPFFSPDNHQLYIPGEAQLVVMQLDETSSEVEEASRVKNGRNNVVGLSDAWHGCASADGRHVYVSDYFARTLLCFERDPTNGMLTFVECLQDRSLTAAPGGKKETMRIIPTARSTDGIAHISSIASAPDSKQILVGTGHQNFLAIFDRNVTTGRLSLVSTVAEGPPRQRTGVRRVQSIAFAEGGKFLVTASLTGGISLFTRNPSERKPTVEQIFYGNGLPKETEQWEPNVKIIPDLKNPIAATFLPDESGLIAASSNDHAVHAFRFDPAIPALKWVGSLRDGENGITGLYKVHDLAVSPDGRFLYAASGNATVAVFEIKL